MRVLHVATEIFPWVKVGGLGDVMGALPLAQRQLGIKARVLLPAYPALRELPYDWQVVGQIPDLLGTGQAQILMARLDSDLPMYLMDAPGLFDRTGGPYDEWGDSYLKFGALSYGAAWLAKFGDSRGWRPALLHCHDWQTALAPVYLHHWMEPPPSVISIHNLAYQGIYPPGILSSLWLPYDYFRMDALEFHGFINFLKGGLQFANRLATVSPTYAREIQGPEMGEGLDGLLCYRSHELVGILNGVDDQVWNPSKSPHIAMHYCASRRSGKLVCKNMLQREMGLEEKQQKPVFAVVSRMAQQKGLDMVLSNIDHLVRQGGQLVVLGSGDLKLVEGFAEAAVRYPGSVACRVGYDEAMAHRILAGSDVLLMPSRHEPCGLTQLYALAFGTLPLVRRTGGLADTVVDATPENVAEGRATGFVFETLDGLALGECIQRACDCYIHEPQTWHRIQQCGMRQDFSWRHAAKEYLALYESVLKD